MVRAGRSIPLPAPRRRRIPWTALLIVAALIAVLFWGAEPAGQRRPEPLPLTRAERDGLKLMDAPRDFRSSGGVRGGSAPMNTPPIR